MSSCAVKDCGGEVHAKGFCYRHYMRHWRGHRLVDLTLAEKILAGVEFDPFGGCWLWPFTTNDWGYGVIRHQGRLLRLHRASWIAFRGPIPEGEGYHGTCVLHRCDVRACGNPDHLFLGDHTANMRDKCAKGRAKLKSRVRKIRTD